MSAPESTPETANEPQQNTAAEADTTQHLLEEMERLRERVAELQERLDGDPGETQRRAIRRPFAVQLRFIMDFDIATGQALDLSDTGMAINVEEPMPFALRYEDQGELVTKYANLVYAASEPGGGHRLGFEFAEPDPTQRF